MMNVKLMTVLALNALWHPASATDESDESASKDWLVFSPYYELKPTSNQEMQEFNLHGNSSRRSGSNPRSIKDNSVAKPQDDPKTKSSTSVEPFPTKNEMVEIPVGSERSSTTNPLSKKSGERIVPKEESLSPKKKNITRPSPQQIGSCAETENSAASVTERLSAKEDKSDNSFDKRNAKKTSGCLDAKEESSEFTNPMGGNIPAEHKRFPVQVPGALSSETEELMFDFKKTYRPDIHMIPGQHRWDFYSRRGRIDWLLKLVVQLPHPENKVEKPVANWILYRWNYRSSDPSDEHKYYKQPAVGNQLPSSQWSRIKKEVKDNFDSGKNEEFFNTLPENVKKQLKSDHSHYVGELFFDNVFQFHAHTIMPVFGRDGKWKRNARTKPVLVKFCATPVCTVNSENKTFTYRQFILDGTMQPKWKLTLDVNQKTFEGIWTCTYLEKKDKFTIKPLYQRAFRDMVPNRFDWDMSKNNKRSLRTELDEKLKKWQKAAGKPFW